MARILAVSAPLRVRGRATSLARRWLSLLSVVVAIAACASRPGAPKAPTPAALAAVTAAPPPSAPTTPADPPLPYDPAAHVATLPNGLRYYVRANHEPAKRASLRLVVNAGSVLETDAEQGMAHFVEHMAFNGTRLFKKQELVDFIEKAGMRFGQHANASTSFDETIYTFEFPTDDPAVLEKAFVMLQQLAAEVSFDPVEVDRERPVVIEEWRLGLGAQTRVMEKLLPTIFKGSRYADRIPIGKKEIIEHATPDQLRAFYKRWYRPNLMAVVAVGDFDVPTVEGHIRKIFSPLQNPVGGPARVEFPVPDHAETLVAVAKDKELTSTSVSVVYKLPPRRESSRLDYRRGVVESTYHQMMNGRLEELTRVPNPPFLGAASMTEALARSKDIFMQFAVVKQDGVERGLAALTREVERVDRFGFTKGELDRQKAEQLRQFERMALEKEKTPSSGYADEMVRNFLHGEAMPGIDAEVALRKEFLGGLTLAELNRVASEWITERNRVILVQAPEAAEIPSDGQLRALFEKSQRDDITAYVDKVGEGPLVSGLRPPGPVVKESHIEELGVTEWRLKNGVRVVVKPTDFKADEISMYAFSPGGSSRIADKDFLSASYADSIVAASGVGPFGPTELRKSLAGKAVGVSPYIDELEEGLSGRASPDDLETMLSLSYLYVTAPRGDAEVFGAWKAQFAEELARRDADPRTAFRDKWQTLYYRNHPRRRPPQAGDADRVSLDTIMKVYKDRFSDAGDFTFVFVGKLDPAKLKPLCEKYLGSLPTHGRKETWRDVGVHPLGGVHSFEVARGTEPKSNVNMTFSGPAHWSREEEQRLDSLTEALSIRLREVVREDLGGTYGVHVGGDMSRRPTAYYRTDVSFACAPDNVPKLTEAVNGELKQAAAKGFAPEYLDKVRAAQRRSLEQAVRSNGYWMGRLTEHYRFGTDPRLILSEGKLIEAQTGADLQAAAKRYLDPHRVLVGVLKPATPPMAPVATPPASKPAAPATPPAASAARPATTAASAAKLAPPSP